jgi:hypothetical protein
MLEIIEIPYYLPIFQIEYFQKYDHDRGTPAILRQPV